MAYRNFSLLLKNKSLCIAVDWLLVAEGDLLPTPPLVDWYVAELDWYVAAPLVDWWLALAAVGEVGVVEEGKENSLPTQR